MIRAGLFLSRGGRQRPTGTPLPPHQLRTDSWAHAYAIFYDALGAGRTLRSFHNSLKATRDGFDSHVDSGRRGWRIGGDPKPLPQEDSEILIAWAERSDANLWRAIEPYADLAVADTPKELLDDLYAESDEDEEEVTIGIDGRAKAIVSRRRERSPFLRAEAIRIHGYACQVCGFSFESTYGDWGRNFIEVHHIAQLQEAPDSGIMTDPARDMAVLCSNCHRMIHRKQKTALTLKELRELLMESPIGGL